MYNVTDTNFYYKTSLKAYWPEWSTLTFEHKKRVLHTNPNLARDGVHYGSEHHKKFAELLYDYFKSKLK